MLHKGSDDNKEDDEIVIYLVISWVCWSAAFAIVVAGYPLLWALYPIAISVIIAVTVGIHNKDIWMTLQCIFVWIITVIAFVAGVLFIVLRKLHLITDNDMTQVRNYAQGRSKKTSNLKRRR